MSESETKQEASSDRKPRARGKILLWVFVGLCWLLTVLWAYLPLPRPFVETFYSRGLYPVFERMLTAVSSPVPFSLSMLIIALTIIGFPLLWLVKWIRLRRIHHQPHWRGMFWGVRWLIILFPIYYLWFMLFWGASYQRLPAVARLELNTEKITREEAADLRGRLLHIILRDLPDEKARNRDRAIDAISRAMEDLVRQWDGARLRLPRRVKATPPGLLLMNGTSGVCLAFMLEPHVDGALPDTTFIYVAAHELGHIAGIGSEAEATLMGYAAGLHADDAFARYAVALDAYLDLARQLPREEFNAAMDRLPEAAHEDLRKAAEASRKYRIDWFRKLSWRAYNRYLKSQGVKEGVKNYSHGITLFTWCWRKGLIEVPPVPESEGKGDIPAGEPESAPVPDAA